MATKDKNIWVLIIFILAGVVVGGLLATGLLMMYNDTALGYQNH